MRRKHFFLNGYIEVGMPRRGRPYYRWVNGYSEALPNGWHSNAMTLRNVRGMAKRDGYRAIIHPDETSARAAILAETPPKAA